MSEAQSDTSGAMIGCVALCGNLMAINTACRLAGPYGLTPAPVASLEPEI